MDARLTGPPETDPQNRAARIFRAPTEGVCMSRWLSRRIVPLISVTSLLALVACSTSSAADNPSANGTCTPAAVPTLTFAAYSTPREVYDAKLIPAFKAMWKDQYGVEPQFFESYTGSTTQAENVVNGSGADVVALSLAPDIKLIEDAGLITHDWTQDADDGMVSTSVVVFDVRIGNPKHIAEWSDLAQPDLGVLTPDPAQSGGARWNLVSLWGSALRGDVPGVSKGDDAGATSLLQDVVGNVLAWDSSARTSIQDFEGGNGDVAITYENEVKTAQASGLPDEAVYPTGSVLIENPVAVVDTNAEAHCVTDLANAFVGFLHSKDAKAAYTETGFLRSTDPKQAQAGDPSSGFPAIKDLFTVEDIGGWDALTDTLFSDDGIAIQAKANAD
jgi:sulfate/thiosulfate-binding protein